MKVVFMIAVGIMTLFNINMSKIKEKWDFALEQTTINDANINNLLLSNQTPEEMQVLARRIMSWQLDNGGWSKDMPEIYEREWNKREDKAKYYQMDKKTPLGTIDNDATVQEIYILSEIYKNVQKKDIQKSIIKGVDFLLEMQYESGAFPQVYPKQDSTHSLYENMGTFNDDATVRVLSLFQKVYYQLPPFDTNLVEEEIRQRIQGAYLKGIDYILESQIVVDGELTGWCAQHDPFNYEPVAGRPFEPTSISGQESVLIAKFLQTVWPRTQKIQDSIDGFVHWLEKVAVEDVKYYRYPVDGRHFVKSPGKLMWYRFYEIGTNRALFGDSDGSIYYSIEELSLERRQNYGYAGDWGRILVSR
jgi:PelA/Pel-15E family pectate lyase